MAKILYADVEAGSKYPERAALLQLSVIAEIDGVVQGTANWFIKPCDEGEITAGAMRITNKPWSDLDAPERVDRRTVKAEFCAFLERFVSKFDKSDKFVLAGYRVNYDDNALRTLFQREGDKFFGSYFWAPSLDVCAIAMQINANSRQHFPNFQLATLLKAYKLVDEAGNALNAEGGVYPGEVQFHDARTDICATRRLHKLLVGEGFVEPVTFQAAPVPSPQPFSGEEIEPGRFPPFLPPDPQVRRPVVA